MSALLVKLPEVYNAYKSWVSKNPQAASDYETTAKWLSYFIAGRINNSQTASELIYCLSNLLVLFNDRIIRKNRQLEFSNSGEKIRLWLTVVEYSEVFCELSAQRLWGSKGRWLVIICIQVFKCVARLILIYHHKDSISLVPPIPVLQRKKLHENINGKTHFSFSQTDISSNSFTLKRSGRIVRKVEASPPLALRSWKPLPETIAQCENDPALEQAPEGKQLVAETIYIVKPVVHLAAMACWGTKAWKPWMLSLAMDLTSLHLYRSNKATLTKTQQLQLSRRTVLLLLYLLRSPFYEKQSKDKINSFLVSLSKNLPLVRLICNPLQQYLPFWQSSYFYMWST